MSDKEWTDTDEIAYLRSRVEELENELAEAGKNQSEYHNTVLAQEKEVARLREMVRWIPVGERLPKLDGVYEVTMIVDDALIMAYQEFYVEHGWATHHQIIAWSEGMLSPYVPIPPEVNNE